MRPGLDEALHHQLALSAEQKRRIEALEAAYGARRQRLNVESAPPTSTSPRRSGPSTPMVTAAIVYWNTLYMGRAVDHLRASGQPAPDHLLAHVAPLGWNHISLTGDYLWREPDAVGDTFLPLRLTDRLRSVA